MTIHREGYTIIATTLAILALINFLSYKFINIAGLRYFIVFVSLVVLGLVVQFFRNPVRHTTINPNHIICPADGKIVITEVVDEPEYFKDKRLQVSIFMSPLNVHVNRSPITGKVIFYKYHPGKYLVAWHPKSSTLNERTTVVAETEGGIPVLFRQIAGAVARRIVCYVEAGSPVTQGGEYGFIKFGSRIDVYLPVGTKLNVKVGDVVQGGETVLATLNP
jgi:phosphatidylserine decarboxylase